MVLNPFYIYNEEYKKWFEENRILYQSELLAILIAITPFGSLGQLIFTTCRNTRKYRNPEFKSKVAVLVEGKYAEMLMERFLNKYRIHSHRLPKWDYSGNGIYFITKVNH